MEKKILNDELLKDVSGGSASNTVLYSFECKRCGKTHTAELSFSVTGGLRLNVLDDCYDLVSVEIVSGNATSAVLYVHCRDKKYDFTADATKIS